VTLFGLIFTPVFYVVIRRVIGGKLAPTGTAPAGGAPQPAE